jgi:hypothetical protein
MIYIQVIAVYYTNNICFMHSALLLNAKMFSDLISVCSFHVRNVCFNRRRSQPAFIIIMIMQLVSVCFNHGKFCVLSSCEESLKNKLMGNPNIMK